MRTYAPVCHRAVSAAPGAAQETGLKDRLLLDHLGQSTHRLGLVRLVSIAARAALGVGAASARDRDAVHGVGVAVVLAISVRVGVGAGEGIIRGGGEL